MRSWRPVVSLLMVLAFFGSLVAVRAQQVDVDRDLEEAKALYREAKFAQAIAKLQLVVARVELLRDLQARKAALADAHLHLALSYVALNDPGAAKESLKALVRADPDRRLDPQVYAPKVIELFEQARREAEAEDAPSGRPPTAAPQAERKGRAKLPLILVGAGGAAAAGLVVASGGGESNPSGAGASPAAPNDVTLVSADPPVGSTISLSSRSSATFRLSVNFAGPGRGWLFMKIADPESFMGRSTGCENSLFTPGFEAGASIPVMQAMDLSILSARCNLPVDIAQLEVNLLREGTTDSANTLDPNMFTISYRITR